MVHMRVILAAIDFSDLSATVLDYAGSLSSAWNARLLVTHVVHDLSYFTGLYQTDTPLDELQQHIETEARERLEALCHSVIGECVRYETLIATGRPLVVLQHTVREHQVDCLVMGAHSIDKPEHQLFGSTAERLIHQITCPVFLIPPRTSSEFISHG